MKPRGLPENQIPTRRALIWPSGSNFTYAKQLKDPGNINHCIEYNLYAGDRYNSAMRAKLLLLGQMTDEPCFNQLRIIEQLGYVVLSGPSFHDDWSGYYILVQSEKDCQYLEARIENSLTTFEQTLNDMSEVDFESHKRAMINNRLEKLKDLTSENTRFWYHIHSDSYDFLQTDVDAATLGKFTKKDMVDFYSQYISTSSSQRSKVSVHLQAQAKANDLSLVNNEALQSRLKDASSSGAISDAAASHLIDGFKMEKEVADKVLGEARAALNVANLGPSAAPQALDASADIESAAGVTWNAWAIRDRIGSILLIAEAANDPDASKRDHFVFGADRRLCQSVHIAERSLLLAIARALWSFEIRKAVDADGKEIVLDAGNLAEGLFVCPKAFSVNIVPRDLGRVKRIKAE
ncbi:insulysin variant [Pyrenophora tritici-repentis Pt-1C-BFP]|uniref:Insulysin variant n=1 Tax=Pyrenophora tritici-repentis (strain Pt-1C-BFP) TaxID=426418 RepID=B2WP37_PYRTR|nr:insulysin variant [Pyrenophora tritici-repentis Pt-1C-BFP]EDU44797.1 insulysin variant [Pyrenophora tritici-repentis Pt-1C-BFP]